MASEVWISKERGVLSLALEVQGARDLWLDESVAWTVSLRFWLLKLFSETFNISGQSVAEVFIEV